MHPSRRHASTIRRWHPGLTEKRSENNVTHMNAVETYHRIADVLRSAQQVAIETENAPDKRKRLRTFSTQEVATLLGLKARDITAYTKSVDSREGGQRNRLSFEELLGLRRSLFDKSNDLRFLPRRRPEMGRH